MLKSLKSFAKQVFFGDGSLDRLVEGVYADQYQDPALRSEIREQYLNRWHPDRQPKTPLSHPELFDPLQPPEGWRYDCYYESWIKIGK